MPAHLTKFSMQLYCANITSWLDFVVDSFMPQARVRSANVSSECEILARASRNFRPVSRTSLRNLHVETDYPNMAPENRALTTVTDSASPTQMNPDQTLRAATALLRKIQIDTVAKRAAAEKTNLLADTDEEPETPVWLVLTTKKHIVDKKRLKPGKIVLPHPYLDTNSDKLRVCLITTDPQRKYKDLIAEPSFPLALGQRIQRVIGIEKLKTKYKQYESRRQLLGEYDVFLADDRIITYLPQVLGKVFYKGGSKRPIPVSLEGKRQNLDEQGNKRRKLAEGGSKVVKAEVKPADAAKEIERALGSSLVHLAPSTTTAVKVGIASMEPKQLQDNVEAVVRGLVEKYVPQQWSNVKSIHIKGPETAALPIWLTEELWADEQDVLDEPVPIKEKSKTRKRGALTEAAGPDGVIEVPGPDGKMRRLEKPSVKRDGGGDEGGVTKSAKKQKKDSAQDDEGKAAEKAELSKRKAALKKQKEEAKIAVNGDMEAKTKTVANGNGVKAVRQARMKAADLI